MRRPTVGTPALATLVLAVLALVVSALPGVAGADSTVDQSFIAPDHGAAVGFGNCCGYMVGQTFTSGRTGVLTGVNIDVEALNGSTLPLEVSIHAAEGGYPTPVILARTVLDSPTAPITRLITFPQEVRVTAGSEYAIVVDYPGAPTTTYMLGVWYSGPFNPYPRGQSIQSYDGNGWFTPSGENDMNFRTYVEARTFLAGSQDVQSQPDSNPAGTAEAFRYAAATTGSATQLSVYLDSSGSANQVIVGLYTNNASNNPGTLIATGTISEPTNGAWNTVPIASANVQAGRDYWLAILAPVRSAGTLRFRDTMTSNGGPTQTSVQKTLAALPTTWKTGARYANSPASMYATAG